MIKKVIDILADFTTLEKNMITEKSGLVTDLGLSSLDVINVVVAFEDEFDIDTGSENKRISDSRRYSRIS